MTTPVFTTRTNAATWYAPAQFSTWQRWLAELTYKPGWSFELRYGYDYPTTTGSQVLFPGPNLLISAKILDSTILADGLLIHTMPMFPRFLSSREAFHAEVLRLVCMVEHHEAMEFLKASGVRVRNPHPSPGVVLYE